VQEVGSSDSTHEPPKGNPYSLGWGGVQTISLSAIKVFKIKGLEQVGEIELK
jgi:hypothetical protein